MISLRRLTTSSQGKVVEENLPPPAEDIAKKSLCERNDRRRMRAGAYLVVCFGLKKVKNET
ncbi:hypothetical protein PROFUN_10824 [Planoprotostelium fungivorum]|uniref:Uncharacterized protein n=1 Tax=Planoprotostelium fungivorum TaxID=1890364 RepID=A0A2P6NCN7_9EUKA|nr:hypothetical protein PROFUN_10824 [Planoprotostelium fungivorum]